MKKGIVRMLVGMFFVATLLMGNRVNASAGTNGMQITAINLPPTTVNESDEDGDDAGGEAVLVESQGKYLLMDTGKEECADKLIKALKGAGVTELDVYISHTHDDHRGGLKKVCENFKVNTIYVPDKSIGAEYKESGAGTTQATIYKIINDIATGESASVKYLKKGSAFSFGAVQAKVLGPVGNYTLAQFASSAGSSGSKSGHYLNNCSLTTMLTCGNTKFLTCGDIEKEEETALVNCYGSVLNADILKLYNHVLATSSTVDFMKAVTPTYSFGENASYVGTVTAEKGDVVKKTYTAQSRAMDYGFCYMVGDEGKNLIIKAEGGKVSLYRETVSTANQMIGWVKIKGIAQISSGAYSGDNTFYLNPTTGIALTGVQKIGGKYYYLGTGGCMERGYYEGGKYTPYRSYGNKIRHFASDGEMSVGFKTISGNKFYFDNQGYKFVGDKKWGIYKLDGKYYAVNENGTIFTNKNKGGWKKYSTKKLRYFNTDGSMVTGWKKVSGKYYYLDTKTGYRTLGPKKIGKYIYFLHEQYGYRLTSKWGKTTSGDKYLLDKKGHAYTGLTKYKGKYYYFDKETGIMQTGLVQDGTKLYYFNPKTGEGEVKTKVKLSGKTYKTNGKAAITNAPSCVKKKIAGLKVTAQTNKVNVKFGKMSGVSGYEVYISEAENGVYKKVKTLSKPSKVSVTINNLSGGKTYFVKVRAYKKIGKVKVYSKYSSAKAVTVNM